MADLRTSQIKKNLFRGTVSSQVRQFSRIILSVLYSIVLLRMLLPRDVGLLFLSVAIVALANIAIQIGLSQGVINFVSKYKDKNESMVRDILVSSFLIQVTVTILVVTTVFLLSGNIALFYRELILEKLIKVQIFSLFAYSIESITNSTFVAYHKYEYMVYLRVINRLLVLVLVPVLIILGYGVIGAAIGETVSNGISTILSLILWKNFLPKSKTPIKFVNTTKMLISYGVPLGLTGVAYLATENSGKLILGIFGPPEWIAYYALASNLSNLPRRLELTPSSVLLPTMSELEAEGSAGNIFETTFKKTVNYHYLFYTIIVGSIVILAEQLIVLFYSSQYLPAVLLMQILITQNLVIAILTPISSVLFAKEKTKIVGFGAIVRLNIIVLELISIPSLGLIGAVVSKVIGVLILGIFYIYFFYRKLQFKLDGFYLLKLNLILLLSILISFVMKEYLSIIIIYGICATFFVSLVIIFRGLTKQDLILLSPILELFPKRLALSIRKIGMLIYSVLRD